MVPSERFMVLDSRIHKLVTHSDLEERLQSVPASAQLRGLYFKNVINVMDKADLLRDYEAYFPETYSAVRWYPVADFLTRAAVAAALLKGQERIHEGLRAIGHNNAAAFADSLLGKTMLRFLAHDPVKLLKQACAARRQSCRYGRWEVQFPEPGMAVMDMFEEYLWIESNVLGAAEGTFESSGHQVTIEVHLESPFRGRHILRWDPRPSV